jgi:hypothetical protein
MDPALNLLSESGGSVASCFMSCESAAGSWPASDVDDDFISCSTDDSFLILEFLLLPHEPLVGYLWVPQWCPFGGLFLYVCMYV